MGKGELLTNNNNKDDNNDLNVAVDVVWRWEGQRRR